MNIYSCKVSDTNGKILKLSRAGVSFETVQAGLQSEGYFPLSIQLKTETEKAQAVRISKKTLLDFTELLSLLFDAGLGVKDGLEIMKYATRDRKIQVLVLRMEKEMKEGISFFTSIQHLGSSLPQIYGSMVRIGETTGDLAYIFKRLNTYLLRRKKIREKLVSALIYPVIVLCVAVMSLILIATFIIPKMTAIFIGMGSSVPDSIGKVLALSQGIFTTFFISVPLILLVILFLYVLGRKNPSVRTGVDSIKLKIPLIGSFTEDTEFINILFNFDALTACGVAIEDTLKEVIDTAGNVAIKKAFIRVREKVLKGVSLSEAMILEKIIPLRISRWIAIGEQAGSMKEVFNQLSRYYENELEKKSSRFMNLIEPALILFTGIIVFGIVLLIIVPLYTTFGTLLK